MAPTDADLVLTDAQRSIVEAPLNARLGLYGPAGCGKSTAGVQRMRHLIASGVPGSSILILAPQRTLQEPYLQARRKPDLAHGSEVDAITVGGLARRLCDLFWPLVGEKAGFRQPERAPFFLTLESSQYYMSYIVRPLLDQGYFQTVTMDRNRLYSQILDSLNKSAAVGFPHTEIGARLDSAWTGDQTQRRVYEEAQDCATRFREFCLQHELLDFSLQLELLWQHLWPDPLVQAFIQRSYRHLIYDNVEEDIPRAHDMLREWLPRFDSALLIYDQAGGFRRFLGADADSAWDLIEQCTDRRELHRSMVMSEPLGRMLIALEAAVREPASIAPGKQGSASRLPIELPTRLISSRFFPQMLDQVADSVSALINETALSPSEIVIVGPYLSDALRFAVANRLEARGIPVRTHRPSRSLWDEPAARALLTIAALAHPHWARPPAKFDVTRAFMKALGMDLVRAHLLMEIVFRKGFDLSSFDDIGAEMQERITYVHGRAYARLRSWLLDYREASPVPLDYFLMRLFGELLSQPGYGFHRGLDDARVAGSLVESVRKFRLAMEPSAVERDHPNFDIGKEFVDLLAEGVLAAQYLESWRSNTAREAVLVAPAHSFLMMNRPVRAQFWLDPGASGWFEHIDQPLTHIRVLSRDWPRDHKWTHSDEERLNTDGLARLVTGLLRRCRESIYLCVSELGESGFEQRGRLLLALNQVMNEARPLAA